MKSFCPAQIVDAYMRIARTQYNIRINLTGEATCMSDDGAPVLVGIEFDETRLTPKLQHEISWQIAGGRERR